MLSACQLLVLLPSMCPDMTFNFIDYLACNFEDGCSQQYQTIIDADVQHGWVRVETPSDLPYSPNTDATFANQKGK